MIHSFVTYKVKIKDIPFTNDKGVTFANTANVSFYDAGKKEVEFFELGFIDTEEIYKLIDQNEKINLDSCYLENLSLTAYRKSRKLAENQCVKIEAFSARNSVFESDLVTDFSFTEIGTLNFSNANFINGRVTFNSSRFTGSKGANFSNIYFVNGHVDFAGVTFTEGEVSFKNSVFGEGDKDFQDADFGNGSLSFVNTEFNDGDVSFINTNFNVGDVSFKVARFGKGKIDFHYSKFGGGDISFERVEFGTGKVDFSKVEFGSGKINFNRAVFGDGEITYEGSQVNKGKMSFKKTIFGNGRINFEIAEFENAELIFDSVEFGNGEVSFYNSKFHILHLQSCHLDNYFDLRVAKCSYLDLSNAIVRDIIDLKPFEFDVKIKLLNITGMRLLGSIYIDWKTNHVQEIISKQEKTSLRNKAEQFRILKENFRGIGLYDDEDKAYVEYMRCTQKADREDAIKKNKYSRIWQYPSYWFKWLIFDQMGHFATSPARVLLSVIIAYIFFSLAHYIIPFFYNIPANEVYNFPKIPENELIRLGTTFYYSSITFFTVGYGDIYPYVGPGKVIAAIEPFFGTFLMSYFTVAFARKILR